VTITAWRICKAKYAKSMWSGIGARSVAGRWHSKGVPVVYVSATISLAAVEQLVHLDSAEALLSFVKCPVNFDKSLVTFVEVAKLPRNWRADPPPVTLRAIGDNWARSGSTPVLAVPSAVVPEEFNYVINPAHPRFGRLRIGKVQPFTFDPRLA
jgi:RES domain-containing protein